MKQPLLLPVALVAFLTSGCNTTLWNGYSEDCTHPEMECVTVKNLNPMPVMIWFENQSRIIQFDKSSTFGRDVSKAPFQVTIVLGQVTNQIVLPNEGGGSHHYIDFFDSELHCCP